AESGEQPGKAERHVKQGLRQKQAAQSETQIEAGHSPAPFRDCPWPVRLGLQPQDPETDTRREKQHQAKKYRYGGAAESGPLALTHRPRKGKVHRRPFKQRTRVESGCLRKSRCSLACPPPDS